MKTLLRTKFFLFFLLICLSFNGYASETPESVVNSLHGELIKIMQASDDLGYEGRYHQLEPVVNASFDFNTIARVVLGRYWKKLDEEQKSRFIKTFSELSTATYAARFDSFSGESFKYLNEEKMKKGRVLVKTQLTTSDRVIPFNYILQPSQDKWHIINVIADGISDLSLKRADYTTIMKTEGFEALIDKIQEKINQADSNNINKSGNSEKAGVT